MRLFTRPLPETSAEETQRGINMVDLMMWLVIAALLLAAAIQSIGYYQQASLTYQAKSDLAGEHSWAAARTALDTKAPTSVEMSSALTAGDLKLTSNGGIYNIGVIATTGDKYCLGVKAPNVKGNNVFYSTSDAPNNVMTDIALPAYCGTATEITTTGTTTVETPSGTSTATSSATATTSATASPTATATASPSLTTTATATATATPTPTATATTPPNVTTTSFSKFTFGDLIISDDGLRLYGLSNDGNPSTGSADNAGFRYSTDGGATWTKTAVNMHTGDASFITGSADGKVVMATANDSYGFYPGASNDYGVTLKNITQGTTTGLYSNYVTPDGKYSVLYDGRTGYIRMSSDYGVNYTAQTGMPGGAGLWISGNGSRILSGTSGANGALYISTNGGTSWVKNTGLSGLALGNIYAASGNVGSTTMIAGFDGGAVYLSHDSGVSWTVQSALGTGSWKNVAASPDGTKLVIAKDGGTLWTSSDSGNTWTEQVNAGTGTWKTVRITMDNSRIVAVRDSTIVKIASF